MPQGIKTTLDFLNTGRIINLPDGVDPQDAATVHQLATGAGTAVWGGITGSINDQTDLISGGKILSSLLPALAITDTNVVSSESEMLALTAETGDIAVRTDETKTYILKGTDPSVLADWELLLTPTGGVVSVFGRSGAVTAQSGDYSFSLISGTAGPTQGGTGLTSYAKGDVLIATGTNTVGVVAASATDGYVFTWDTASGLPMWKAAAGGGGSGIYAGTGTPFTSYTKGDLIYASDVNILSKLPADTDYKVLTMIGGLPVWSASGVSWSRSGNAGTIAGTDFLGTTDDVDFVIKRNNFTMVTLGNEALSFGINASTGYRSNFFGSRAGFGYNATYCNFFGYSAGENSNPIYSNFYGYMAGLNATSANNSNFFGYWAGKDASNAAGSNFFGQNAGVGATSATASNFFGQNAGAGATGATYSNFFGAYAGSGATNASRSNFFGRYAGEGATNASYSNIFGYLTGRSFTGNNIGTNNIIIGTHISLPNAAANSINIGGVLFGVGTYNSTVGDPSIIPQTTGRIGIGIVVPNASAILDLTSTTMGFLPPRMTTTQRTAIASPAEGLTVYDISLHKLYTFDGTTWQAVW